MQVEHVDVVKVLHYKKLVMDHTPIYDKIKRGDYNYSRLFKQADKLRKEANYMYDQTYKNYGGTDEKNRLELAQEAAYKHRLRAIKMELEAHKEEQLILWKLRRDLQDVFGVDLWDSAIEEVDGDLFALFDIYKKLCER